MHVARTSRLARLQPRRTAARHRGDTAILTYATIAAGEPASTAAITNHYLTQTLPKEAADLARYYTQGTPGPQSGEALADLRQDMHPLVAKGLGIEPERPLTKEEIGALLAGRRADGKKIEGKRYSAVREYTDPKTGEKKEKVPLGAVDFTLTPDKSVSVAWAFAAPARAGRHPPGAPRRGAGGPGLSRASYRAGRQG
jgi:hypothetical protein